MLRVSGRTSAKTGRAPRNTKAFAVETKVHEVVNNAALVPTAVSSRARHLRVNAPSPEMCPAESACQMYSNSLPVSDGRLNGRRGGEAFGLASPAGEVRGVVSPIRFSISKSKLLPIGGRIAIGPIPCTHT